jgi:hypothetical protein
MIEPNAHHELYESPGREPDQAEQNWLRAEQDEQDWLRAELEILTTAAIEVDCLRHLPLVRLKEALEGHHGLPRVQESGRSF